MSLYIKVGSITNAQRGKRLLEKYKYKAVIKRIENPKREDGCGYALLVDSDTDRPVQLISNEGIIIRGVERIDLS